MTKHLTIPVYNQELLIYSNYTDAERYAIVETPPLTLRYNKDTWCLSVMAHECVHIVNFLLANVGQGMPYKDQQGYYDDEYYSYLYAAVFCLVFEKTKQDLKEIKNGPRSHRTKKMLQHSGKKTTKVKPRAEELVIH